MTRSTTRRGVLATAACLGLTGFLPVAADAASALQVTGRVGVRTGPSASYGLLGSAGAGQIYVGTAKTGSWWKVFFNGRMGYLPGASCTNPAGLTGV